MIVMFPRLNPRAPYPLQLNWNEKYSSRTSAWNLKLNKVCKWESACWLVYTRVLFVKEMCLCHTEQLEAFKKHMEAGETNTSAIIMGEENEDETENGQLFSFNS